MFKCLLLLVFITLNGQAFADEYTSVDQLLDNLGQVSELIKAGRIDAAQEELERIKQSIEWDKHHGHEYPNIVRNTIVSLRSLIREEAGDYDYYARMAGTVTTVHFGPAYLYLEVQAGRETMTFLTDAGIILNEDACMVEKGSSVVVYFENILNDLNKAFKIVCQKK